MPGPERSFAQQKTCPNPDKGSRLATPAQESTFKVPVTYGSLATRHPLPASVEGSKNPHLLYRVTPYEQVLIPTTKRVVAKRSLQEGRPAKPCRPANRIKAKQRRQQRGYLQQVKGLS